MAIGSTLYSFEIALTDPERNVYESLTVRAARHSSETIEYLLCRVLAYCLEYTEGLEFSKGLDDAETPAIWARDLTGKLTHWIEIGSPSPEKLHKASKNVDRIVVYTHKNAALILQQLNDQKIYRADEIKLHAFDTKFIDEIALLTERRNTWALSVSEGTIYLDVLNQSYTTTIETYVLT